jgi:hypothetical protein
MYGHHRRLERIAGAPEQPGQDVGEDIGPFGAVEDQHCPPFFTRRAPSRLEAGLVERMRGQGH